MALICGRRNIYDYFSVEYFLLQIDDCGVGNIILNDRNNVILWFKLRTIMMRFYIHLQRNLRCKYERPLSL